MPYVGSKKSLLKYLIKLFPEEINNYYEPFVGAGSVLFYLNENYDINKNYINDLDADVINIYKAIKNDTKKFLKYLKEINKIKSKKEYGNLVDIFNERSFKKDKVLLAAIYIYMCKRSFNSKLNMKDGLIRPYYAKTISNKKIYDENTIDEIKDILDNTKISNMDYIKFLNKHNFKKDDFVFLDPPYLTTNTKYNYSSIFDYSDYEKLKKVCDKLDSKKVNFMLTTNKHSALKKLFNEYNIKTVNKYSRVSQGKGTEYEMIITNY